MNFKIIETIEIQDKNNSYEKHCFYLYHETTTDVLYVAQGESGGLTPMLDPETGLPLTYSVWQAKYRDR